MIVSFDCFKFTYLFVFNGSKKYELFSLYAISIGVWIYFGKYVITSSLFLFVSNSALFAKRLNSGKFVSCKFKIYSFSGLFVT